MDSGPPRYSLNNTVFSDVCEPYQRFGMVFFATERIDERVVRALQPCRTTTAHAVISEIPGKTPVLAPGDWAGIYEKDGRRIFVLCAQHADAENRPLALHGTWKQLAEAWQEIEVDAQGIAQEFGYQLGDCLASCPLTSVRLSRDSSQVCVTSGCVSRLPEFTSDPPPTLVVPSPTKTRVWIIPPTPTVDELGVIAMVSKRENYIPLDHGDNMFAPSCPCYEDSTYDNEAWVLQRNLTEFQPLFTIAPGALIEESAKQLT